MENREYAQMLAETADLMEIAAEDGFRIRSYRNGASARSVGNESSTIRPAGHLNVVDECRSAGLAVDSEDI